MSYLKIPQPVTPEPKRSISVASDVASDEQTLQFLTPDVQQKVNTLKRKASDISEKSPPQNVGLFIKWRLALLEAELALRETLIEEYSQTIKSDESDIQSSMKARIDILKTEQADLEDEWLVLEKQKPFIREDLHKRRPSR